MEVLLKIPLFFSLESMHPTKRLRVLVPSGVSEGIWEEVNCREARLGSTEVR